MKLFDPIFAVLPVSWLDVAALVVFAAAWSGYQWYSDYSDSAQPRLGREMDRYLHEWLMRMAERDNRMVDVNVLHQREFRSQTLDLLRRV